MVRRCVSRLVVLGAALATGVAPAAAPASAGVTYDPDARTGFVAGADLRRAFGWSAATLTARAGDVAFDHDFWTDDTYSATCGPARVPVVHHREFGRYELADAVVRRDGPRSSTGYGDGVTGFRLTGASFGISGTSVAPAVGQSCPGRPGTTIGALKLVSTAAGWALAARSGETRRELLSGDGRAMPESYRLRTDRLPA